MRRVHQRVSVAAIAVTTLIALGSSARASDRYVRVGPSFIAPAPHTYGPVVAPPPFYIYDPAPILLAPPQPFYVYHPQPVVLVPQPEPVVYEIPTQTVQVAPIPVGGIRYEYHYGYNPEPSYRHGRYSYKFDGRDSYGGRVRYRLRYRYGRVRASLKYRP